MIGIYGGNFQFFNGAVVANGTLTLQLSWDSSESVTTPGGIVVSAERVSYTLDLTGNLPLTQIWSNAELSVPTYYVVNVYDKNGVPVFKAPFIWVFLVTTGGTVDIGTLPNQSGEGGLTYEPLEGPTGPTGPIGPTGPQGLPGEAVGGGGVQINGGVSSSPYNEAPTLVQTAQMQGVTNSLTCTLGTMPTVGNTLVCFVQGTSLVAFTATLPAAFTQLANLGSGTCAGVVGYMVVTAANKSLTYTMTNTWPDYPPYSEGGYGGMQFSIAEILGTPFILANAGDAGEGYLPYGFYTLYTDTVFSAQPVLAIVGFEEYFTGGSTDVWSPDNFNVANRLVSIGGSFNWILVAADCPTLPAGPITSGWHTTADGYSTFDTKYVLALIYNPISGPAGPTGPTGASGSSEIEETLFLGYFVHGTDVSLARLGATKFTSPIDSFVYTSQSQILYYQVELVSTRYPATTGTGGSVSFVNGQMTDPGPSNVSALSFRGELWYFYSNVIDDPTNAAYNTLFLYQSYWDGEEEQAVNAGYAKVFAVCARSL